MDIKEKWKKLEPEHKNRIINISITGVIAALRKWLKWRKDNK